ncbi:hypothetical protein JOL79_00085 [Microbispora sp. RL4-1S]|uniref:Uncharacterized protein n=1 Tax=Microbispora oryzae TaxID=2806554 RepID=A0A941AHK2_9ACTN|nr:hypothetical protein [Microbispora oryzae]MBP2702193.1 hypothetical protein [Microbispora oryzae]
MIEFNQRNGRTEQPTPENPEPLVEEARREEALEAGRTETETPDGTTSAGYAETLDGTRAADVDAADRDADERHDPHQGPGPVFSPAVAREVDTREEDADPAPVSEPVSEALDADRRWHEIKAGFVDDPRRSVERADELVDEALSAVATRRRSLLDHWKDGGTGDATADTEALRVALHEYHALLVQLTGK